MPSRSFKVNRVTKVGGGNGNGNSSAVRKVGPEAVSECREGGDFMGVSPGGFGE